MAVSSGDVSTTLFFVVILALIYTRRIVLSYTGTPVSGTRIALYSAFVGLLFTFAVLTGYTLVPWYVYPVLAAALAGAFLVAEPYVRGRVVLEERSPGRWVYKLSPVVPLVYIVLFVVRLLLDLFVLNVDPLTYSYGSITVSSGAIWVLVAVDLLFAISTGLILGRNIGVYRVYAAKLHVPSAQAPLP
jgi:hypothetical protein